MSRVKPNILITGTPGTGKSILCSEIAKEVNFEWLEISKIAKERNCLAGYDNTLCCPIIDEDKVIDELDPVISEGGKIVEYHGCDFFPERWFDAVYVLRTTTDNLYDRLQQRGYSDLKVGENVQCEIFQTILDEARTSYEPSIIEELQSNEINDIEHNTQIILKWINKWMTDTSMKKCKMFKNNKNSID